MHGLILYCNIPGEIIDFQCKAAMTYSLPELSNCCFAFSIEPLTNSAKYDFTKSAQSAFGNNLKPIDASPVAYGIFNGDVNQDGTINLTDIISTYNGASNFLTGYKVTDLTGDNITNLTDILIAYNNSAGFVRSIRP